MVSNATDDWIMTDTDVVEKHLLVLIAVAEVGGDRDRVAERLKETGAPRPIRSRVGSAIDQLLKQRLVERPTRDNETYQVTARGRSAGLAIIRQRRDELDRMERALRGQRP
jgi:hypothetical protein